MPPSMIKSPLLIAPMMMRAPMIKIDMPFVMNPIAPLALINASKTGETLKKVSS